MKKTLTYSAFAAITLALVTLSLPACNQLEQQAHAEHEHQAHTHKMIVTSPVARDVITTQEYVCQIHSCRHIEVRALEGGYLQEIHVREGQSIQQGEEMFKIVPTLFQARLDAEMAEAQVAEVEFNNTKRLFDQNVVAQPEVALAQAKLAKAKAQVQLAQAELNFTDIKAPFPGIVDRLQNQLGSLIEEGDILTTLSDNQTMWVYFNVPEARYLEYQANLGRENSELKVQLKLADGSVFPYEGKIAAVEADFNNETGNIAFRADFPNPDGLLRHGQTGNIMLSRTLKNAVVIPQRATFEILAKKYAMVVDDSAPLDDIAHAASHSSPGEAASHEAEDHSAHSTSHAPVGLAHTGSDSHHDANLELGMVHQREIRIVKELEDIFVVDGLKPSERLILEGVQQARDGQEIEYEYRQPEDVLKNLKNKAE